MNLDRPLFATFKRDDAKARLGRDRYHEGGRNDVGERVWTTRRMLEVWWPGDVSYQKTIPIPTWAIRTWAFLRSVLETNPRKSSRTSAYWQQPAANGTYIVTAMLIRRKMLVIYAKIGREIRSNLTKSELAYSQFYGPIFPKVDDIFKKVLFYIQKDILFLKNGFPR